MQRRYVLIAGASAMLSGCGLFGSATKREPKPLAEIKPQMTVRVVWSERIGSSNPYELSPAVAGDTIVAANTDGHVFGIDGTTGRRLWRTSLDMPISSGVAVDDATVIVGGSNGMAAGLSIADGSVRWKVQLPAELLGRPVIARGFAILRASDSRLFALDAASGERRWVLQRPLPPLVLRSSAGLAQAGELVFGAFPGGRLLGIDSKSGAIRIDAPVALPKGTTELERIADVVGVPAVSDDLVCATAYQGRIACLNTTNGTTIWAREFSSSVGPAVDSRYVFAVDDASVLQAFTRGTGGVLWTVDRFKHRALSSPASWGRAVAVGDYRGFVHLLNREDGTDLARVELDGSPIRATPVVFEKDATSRLIVQTSDGRLAAIGNE